MSHNDIASFPVSDILFSYLMPVLSIVKTIVPSVVDDLMHYCPWPKVVVVLLFYVQSKHLRSCRDGQLPNHTFPGQA